MIIIRPIRESDLDQYEKLAFTATLGITNLPKNRELLQQKIQKSLQAFHEKNPKIGRQDYCFVLEDLSSGEIGGTCGVFSRTGTPHPLIYYKVETLSPTKKILRYVAHTKGPTEVCALYIAPEWRKEGLGRLLSLSRFLFIANFLERFEETVFAEMRGVITPDETSPFWEGLGRQSLNLDYSKVMAAQEIGDRTIYDSMPQFLIDISQLPLKAQEVIGKPHVNTKPALNMLVKEGFQPTGEIDVFDGGPRISAKTREIATIKNSHTAKVVINDEKQELPIAMISNTALDFRSCYGTLLMIDGQRVQITEETAKALNVKNGDQIRYMLRKE